MECGPSTHPPSPSSIAWPHPVEADVVHHTIWLVEGRLDEITALLPEALDAVRVQSHVIGNEQGPVALGMVKAGVHAADIPDVALQSYNPTVWQQEPWCMCRGAVVHHQQFPVDRDVLGEDALEALGEQGLPLVRQHTDAKRGHVHSLLG